jgi:hypothetical protein
MALPIQAAPKYNLTLPITNKKVSYRPFLVKEQRSLLLARESESTTDVFEAVCDMISSVTNGKVDAMKLPVADLEYLFLQIRAKSVGETADVSLACTEKECSGFGQASIDLNSVEVDVSGLEDNRVELSETLIVEMQAPTTSTALKMEGLDEAESIKPMLRACMTRIFDEDSVYELSEYRDSEIDDFIESMTVSQFEKISDWFTNLPTLKHDVEYACGVCKTHCSRTLEGLNSFF